MMKNRWLFGVLYLITFGEFEVYKKFVDAIVYSSHVFVMELALIFIVFPLHFWRSPKRLIPEDHYIVAWGVLTSFICVVADRLYEYRGMPGLIVHDM
ncbi:uncharacterized protein ColSpa_11412 [Colletotrichum spaethianum]|uniref:Uncharacterized protein n=1 Tax=Colletotrichum spaethianum TaxID=700344 RepID=A0AA37PFA6_9PEZI|nr:uncharacterized protein ColSpa_11412 [Colletotrichum spaethianum]GKT51231.1 hypothetical protein ColSpa_11412 [Colletotrichum spaethianum]